MNNFQKLIRRFRKTNSAKQTAGTRGKKGLRHRKRKPLSKKAKIWIAVGCTLGVLLIAGIITGVVWFKTNFSYEHNPISKDPTDLGITPLPDGEEYPGGITNIALFGVDSRNEEDSARSDSIMIISINSETGSIKLVSIMRDSLVKVDGHGYQKINAAYSKGGPTLAIKTLNQSFSLNIQNYATVDFVGMAEIVDAVGGIEAELTKAEVANANAQITEMANTWGTPKDYIQSSGKQTLSGIQAVAFSRVRYVATINGTRDDYGRTERQRLVMSQLFQKALSLPVTQYPSLIKTLLPYVETSLGYNDILSLATTVLKAKNVSMQQNRIPVDDAIISGGYNVNGLGSCVYYDLEFAAELLHAFFFDDITFEDYIAANGIRKNNWYGGSSGSSGSSGSKNTATSSATDTLTSDTGTSTDTPSSSQPANSSGSTSGTTTDTSTTTDSGTGGSTDKEPSVSTSLPILPSTSTSTSTGDTTDTGTTSEPEDTNTSTESSGTGSDQSTSSDAPASSTDRGTSDSGDSDGTDKNE